jgi:hypothetical protein
MKNEIAKFVKESVEWLVAEQEGCCRYKLDDHLAIFVGWSAGYGNEKRDDVIQAKDDPDYGINVGIKVWTSDYMWTDFDWLNFPYYDDGEVLDMSLAVAFKDDIADGLCESVDYQPLAESLLRWYGEVKDLVLADDGRILEDNRYDYKVKEEY